MNSGDMREPGRKHWRWEKYRSCQMLASEKKLACENNRNYSVPSQLRAKIHSRSASLMGFLPSSLRFLTVSAASAQTY